MPSAEAALRRLTDPLAKVSAHYLIDEDGTVMRMVDEQRRAWHAGVSSWQGRAGLNDCSIGIEIVNPGHEWGYRPFAEAQYAALERLCPAIMDRWSIPAARVLAHSDIAPERKEDPGELFDWRRLAQSGVGLWPAPGAGTARTAGEIQGQLARIGYGIAITDRWDRATRRVLMAFQRHFRPDKVDGEADRDTRAMIDGLLAER